MPLNKQDSFYLNVLLIANCGGLAKEIVRQLEIKSFHNIYVHSENNEKWKDFSLDTKIYVLPRNFIESADLPRIDYVICFLGVDDNNTTNEKRILAASKI